MVSKRKKKIIVLGDGFIAARISAHLKGDTHYAIISAFHDMHVGRLPSIKKFFAETRPEYVINGWSDTGGIGYSMGFPANIITNNMRAILNIYEASHESGVKKIINLISNSTYPQETGGRMEESRWWSGPWHPSAIPIASSGKQLWAMSYAYHAQYGLAHTNLIIGNVYGPGDYFDEARSYALQALIIKITKAYHMHTKEVLVLGTGKPVRDWLYIDDLTAAVKKAIDTETDIQPINIGSGTGISIRNLAYTIQKIIGYTGSLSFDSMQRDGAPYKVMDIRRAQKILFWKPRMTFANGLAQTIAWYLKNKA